MDHGATWQPPGLGSPQSGSTLRSSKTTQTPTAPTTAHILPTHVAKCRWKAPSFSWIVTKAANMMVGENCGGGVKIQSKILHCTCMFASVFLALGENHTVLFGRAWSCRLVWIFNANQSSKSSSGLHSFQRVATSTSAASAGKAASESEKQDRRQLWDVAGDRSIHFFVGYLNLGLRQ